MWTILMVFFCKILKNFIIHAVVRSFLTDKIKTDYHKYKHKYSDNLRKKLNIN